MTKAPRAARTSENCSTIDPQTPFFSPADPLGCPLCVAPTVAHVLRCRPAPAGDPGLGDTILSLNPAVPAVGTVPGSDESNKRLAVRFPEEVHTMLHPNQFQVNETWIIFKLNDAPVITDRDGDFNVFALMDAASCFILDTGFVPSASQELSETEAKRLLKKGYGHKKQYARELIISGQQTANNLSIEAERCGISVSRVPEDQLRLLINEARESFQEYISNGRCQ